MIDLCIVSFNNLSQIDRLLSHLSASSPLDHLPTTQWRLHICDNGSTDGTAEWLCEAQSRFLIDNLVLSHNQGYARACNHLASLGTGDIVALLNADVWFTVADLEMVQAAFEADESMAVLGPKQRNEMGSITHAGIFGSNIEPKHRGWRQPDPDDLLYRDRLEAVTVSGSSYFVRRQIWDEMSHCPIYRSEHPYVEGAFLPTSHYYEETWFSYHVREHGYKVIYDGTISIGHSWHASSPIGGDADKFFPISQDMFRRMCDKHGIARD